MSEENKPEWMNPYSMPIYPATGGVLEPGLIADNHDAPEIIYTPIGSVVPARGFWDRLSETINAVYAERQQSEQMRAMIRAEVRQVLEDDAREIRENNAFQPVSIHEHRRVEMTEESGKQWRGVLYRVDDALPADEAKTDPELPAVNVPSGVCWACGEHGESDEMMWFDFFGRPSHLIHATSECIQTAAMKPDEKEHRGWHKLPMKNGKNAFLS